MAAENFIEKMSGVNERNVNDYDDKERVTNKNGEKERDISKYIRSIVINTKKGKTINPDIINYNLYNRFNYSLFLSDRTKTLRLCLGVTSPNKGEGKTTAACNLATALSVGSLRKTLIIDFNINNPAINKIFGTPEGPGLTEAMMGEKIFVTPTQIDNLSVLPVGNIKMIPETKLASFNEILLSLLREFEFIIVDMPSISSRNFPTLIANQLNGLIVVIEARKTKRRDIERMFRNVNERNVCGFVLNRVNENDF